MDIEAALELAVTESRANLFEDLPQDISMITAVAEDSTALSVQSSPKKRKKLQITSDSEDEVAAIASPTPHKSPSKSSKQDPPVSTSYVIPAIILNKLLDELVGKEEDSLDKETAIRICKYWSFKRGARQGAPLLKRLHLEVFLDLE